MITNSNNNPWLLKKIVLPQHTDHAGVMWHGSYLNWLEESRVNALSQVGLSYANLSKNGYEMPVVELRIQYINALNHGDQVLIKSWSLEQKGVRLPWKTILFNTDNKPAAKAMVNLVLIRKFEAGVRIIRRSPENITKALFNLKKGPN